MTAWDTAEALKRILKHCQVSRQSYHRDDEGYAILGERIGKSREFVRQMLSLLNEQPNVIKALKEDKIKWTPVVEIRKAPNIKNI